jgi:hypothetical protein
MGSLLEPGYPASGAGPVRSDNAFDTLADSELGQGIEGMSLEGKDGRDLGAIARYGVSEELVGLFESLRETPGVSGLKFRSDDINRLARAILFRNYGKSCLELSYLLTAVISGREVNRYQTPLLEFFWLEENITPKRFRETFNEGYSDSNIDIRLEKGCLNITVEKEQFAISPTRVAYLAALLEFVVFIDPAILSDAESELNSPRAKKVKAFSSALQKKIYAFLADHLQPAQQQRRFRRLFSWCRHAKVEEQTIDSTINDEAVLMFWKEAALEVDDSIGFRRFRTVGEDFIALKKALDVGRSMQQVADSRPIGYDTNAGEWHPDQLEAIVAEQASDMPSLDFLARQPKFLTADQISSAAPVTKAGEQCLILPLTLVRMEVFGAWQAKLSQAEKDQNRDRLNNYLQSTIEQDYESYSLKMQALRAGIEEARLLGLGVLLEMEDDESMALIADMLSADGLVKLGQLAQADNQSEALSGPQFFSMLPQWCLQLPELNRLCQDARALFKKTNRAGFQTLPDKKAVDSYLLALDTLRECKRVLERFLDCIDMRLQQSRVADYLADVSIFREVFTVMYGERS